MIVIKLEREVAYHIVAHDRQRHAALENKIAEGQRRIAAATAVPGEKVVIEIT